MNIKILPSSKIQLPLISLTVSDILALLPVCKSGLPDTIPADMLEAIETLICLSVNPLRPGIEMEVNYESR